MKGYLKIAMAAALIMLLAAISARESYAISIDKTTSVGATATKPIVSGPTLDDFNTGQPVNVWGGATGTGAKDGSTASCVASYPTSDAPVTTPGKCLRLDYNITDTNNSYAYYWSSFGGGTLGSYKSVSFWVKGTAGALFKIELKDTSNNTAVVYVNEYHPNAAVTTSWTQVTIPFANFVNVSNWASMNQFVITFEYDKSYANGSPLQGSVYIDNITFNTATPSVVRISHFSEKVGMCAMGGNIGDLGGGGGSASHSFTSSSGTYNPLPCGLLSSYNVNVGYAGNTFIFGGGTDGWTSISRNFSSYYYLNFYAKAYSSTANPKSFKVELIDGSGTRTYYVSGITNTSWSYFHILLTNFSGLDKTTIKQVNFVYEDWNITNYGGNKVGGVYFDSIEFSVS